MTIKHFVVALIALLTGVVITGLALQLSAKNALILEIKSPYDYNKTVAVIKERIMTKSGWHLADAIDQQGEILAGGGPNVGPVTIIKYCNAHFAGRMLGTDERKKMAVAMPISIAVYDKSTGETYISLNNGYLTSKLYGGETEEIIEEVSRDVEEILSFAQFKYTRF